MATYRWNKTSGSEKTGAGRHTIRYIHHRIRLGWASCTPLVGGASTVVALMMVVVGPCEMAAAVAGVGNAFVVVVEVEVVVVVVVVVVAEHGLKDAN